MFSLIIWAWNSDLMPLQLVVLRFTHILAQRRRSAGNNNTRATWKFPKDCDLIKSILIINCCTFGTTHISLSLRDICVHVHVQEAFSLFAMLKKISHFSSFALFLSAAASSSTLHLPSVSLRLRNHTNWISLFSQSLHVSAETLQSFTPRQIAEINIYRVTSESFTQNPICIGSRASNTLG